MISVLLYQILAYTIHGKIQKKLYEKNKFKISASAWNEESGLPGASYSISNIQDYFKYIFKSMGKRLLILQ